MTSEGEKGPSLPWPVPGDVLFKSDTDWQNNACLWFGADRWEIYATGYLDAANILIERIQETNNGMDTLVYPVVFLYRHYLELRLKKLIIDGQRLLVMGDDLQRVHRLDLLWQRCRPMLEQIWPTGPKADLDAVEECLRQFWDIDNQSQAFRYPCTKDGAPTLQGLEHINLRNTREVMERIASLLDSASAAILEYLDSMNDR